MSRNRPGDSSKRAQPGSALKIDLTALVVMALTAFFATLFATLVLLRPEARAPTEPLPVKAPPVNAPPPEPIPRAEPKPEPKPDPTLQTRLEPLGIKCAEGADCYPE